MKQRSTKDKENTQNVVYVKGSDEAAISNRENLKRLVVQRKKLAALLAVAIIFVAAFVVMYINKEYKGYKVVKNNETNYENTANYIQFNGNILKYTPDGVSYINTNGDTIWSAGINMKMPMAVVSGSYAVIADMSGNSVCVFSNEGQISSVTLPYAICDLDVGNQGAFAVVLESDETNYINLYNKKGEIIYERKTTINKSGYPLDITISDDAKKLFTSYLNIGATSVQNNLAAYNFGDVGQNSNADRIVGGYTYEDEVVPKVEFIDNDTVVAFGTKSICIFAMKEKPSKKAELEFDSEIRSVFYNTKYIGVVQGANDENSEHMYKIKVYNLRGNLEFDDYIDFSYDNIYAADKEIIVTGGNDCIIYRTNGSVKFQGKLSGKIVSMVPSGNRLEYVVVYDNATEIIKLKSSAEKVAE